jgi:hypothetical protein
MPEQYTFTPGHCLLVQTRSRLESLGWTCAVDRTDLAGHELETLTATPPTRPNRAERGCTL